MSLSVGECARARACARAELGLGGGAGSTRGTSSSFARRATRRARPARVCARQNRRAQGGRERATSEGAGGPAERRGRGQAGLRLLRAGHPASGHKLVAPLVTRVITRLVTRVITRLVTRVITRLVTRVITRLVTRVLGAAAGPPWCGGGQSGGEAGGGLACIILMLVSIFSTSARSAPTNLPPDPSPSHTYTDTHTYTHTPSRGSKLLSHRLGQARRRCLRGRFADRGAKLSRPLRRGRGW